MGLRDAFHLTARVAGQAVTPSTTPHLSSPFRTSSNLSKVVLSDIVGLDPKVTTRADAVRVPAISKGRALIAGTLSKYPLAMYEVDSKVAAPAWLYKTRTKQSPQARMLWTLDDLIFHGASLWAVERAGDDADGEILDAVRVLPDEWEITADLVIKVRGEEVTEDQVILIEGPQDGLLSLGSAGIASSHDMRRAWAARVRYPIPMVELRNTDPNLDLTDDEIADLVEASEAARREGGTSYTPAGIEMNVHGEAEADLFVEGRNAERLDWANFLNLPAALMEGSLATATLTYSTTEGKRSEFVDYSLSYWATAVEARLSLDDVVPEGMRVAFDLSWLTTHPQLGNGPAVQE